MDLSGVVTMAGRGMATGLFFILYNMVNLAISLLSKAMDHIVTGAIG